jgi:methylated-DNA-protein-cysteine methyltransferase-like protein
MIPAIKVTEFTKKVMKLLKQIPRGQVATYGQIAALAGKPHGARGVGWILNSSAEAYDLPWQRVINSKGKISFSKRTAEYREQKKLLIKEKIRFSEDDSISLEIYQWKKQARALKPKRNQPRIFG